jgi:LPXTG-site transpeptidase (sortase) family protein
MLNVSPFDESIYLPILDQNLVAHAEGTDLPNQGKGNSTYIFAHSSQQGINRVRNNSVFYLLNDLKNGDVVYIKNADKAYLYIVYDKKIVGPKEINNITAKDPEKEVLILQTCWPIGTDWKRLLIYAARP